MDKARRFALFVFILGLVLFVGLVLSAWVVPNVVLPAAQAVWLFLRIFVLSIDQEYFWYLLTVTGAMWGIYRLTRGAERVLPDEHPLPNEALSNLKNWQDALVFSAHATSERSIVKSRLILLLTSYYAVRQPGSSPMEIRTALEGRQLPLPDPVYKFLFLREPEMPSRLSWQAVSQAWRRRYRHLTGQEAAEFHQMIDQLIHFVDAETDPTPGSASGRGHLHRTRR